MLTTARLHPGVVCIHTAVCWASAVMAWAGDIAYFAGDSALRSILQALGPRRWRRLSAWRVAFRLRLLCGSSPCERRGRPSTDLL